MNEIECQVIMLLGEGYSRREVADALELGDTTVRRVIKRLCEYYGCTQRELPGVAAKENSHE